MDEGAGSFAGKTVMVLAAGQPLGRAMAVGFADAGAQVIVLDRDEAPLITIARHDPAAIEGLSIDLRRAQARRQLSQIWGDYPLDVLIDLHALRDADRPWDALRLIPAMIGQLSGALQAGDGAVILAMDRAPQGPGASLATCHQALRGLAPALLADHGSQMRINMLECAADAPLSSVVGAASVLAAPQARGITGALIPVGRALD